MLPSAIARYHTCINETARPRIAETDACRPVTAAAVPRNGALHSLAGFLSGLPSLCPRSWHGTAGGGDGDERCEPRSFGHDKVRTIQTDHNWAKTRVPADFIEYGARRRGTTRPFSRDLSRDMGAGAVSLLSLNAKKAWHGARTHFHNPEIGTPRRAPLCFVLSVRVCLVSRVSVCVAKREGSHG